MIEAIQLIRNVGTFDSVNSGARLPLKQLSLIYAENGRGKTTLAAILRSLGNADPIPILERKRLGATHPPHVVIAGSGDFTAIFENGQWTNRFSDYVIFDDHFVAENVCSGLKVETAHRQNLHEWIIGAQGVALNAALQEHIDRIEKHNRDLQAKGSSISPEVRGGLNIDQFCALEARADIDQAIKEAEQNLAAAREANAVREQAHFIPISLPAFDLVAIGAILNRELPDLEAEAVSWVQTHLGQIGDGGEIWIEDGMKRIHKASSDQDHDVCPFCTQDLRGSSLITHYQAYFSEAYRNFKQSIVEEIQNLNLAHSGEIQAAFERDIRIAVQTQQFWSKFTTVPEISLDTATIALAWKQTFEAVSSVLLAKQASPLDQIQINETARQKVAHFHALRDQVIALSNALVATRPAIDLIKEKVAAANIPTLENDLAKLKGIKARFSPEIVPLCDAYMQEKRNKEATEKLRDSARVALNQYRENVFPTYETAINTYLQRFNAGFRLGSVNSVNTRTGSSCNYHVLINNVTVPLSAGTDGEPSFRNTLSGGDRNTLALAFFFASLENDPNRNQKVIVIDDPMTSLDEHRSLTTIQEMRRLLENVAQVIVLSHSKTFLCELWQGADTDIRSAMKIARSNPGSTLVDWDVNQDCITEHDRRHAMVRDYIQNSVGSDERAVAAALRPILESFMRVAYPQWFPPGTLLGPFINLSQQREGTADQILSSTDRIELRALLDYANQFHHDTNTAWQTATINDHELLDFSRRTLQFAQR